MKAFSFWPKWVILKERMGDEWYYMLYRSNIFGGYFYERWNTEETALLRLSELRNPKGFQVKGVDF